MKRKTSQYLMPLEKQTTKKPSYDIYPSFPLEEGIINLGYDGLVDEIVKEKVLLLDGYIGVDWKEIGSTLTKKLKAKGLSIQAIDIETCMKEESEINRLKKPFLRDDGSIFGFKTTLAIKDFFDSNKIDSLSISKDYDITLIYGTGASQANIDGFLVYFDLPKNELQFRMRAGCITNFGSTTTKDPKQMYKHFYFVDWVVLNKEKKRLLPKISIIVDQQRPSNPTWTTGTALRRSLAKMSKTYFRARPWFEPGVWGGQWMKERFLGLNLDVPNYAWSFEMIVPENGLVFENSGKLLEVSFDMLMFQESENILGKAAKRFQDEFPIRFDFLDTYDGGNLSVQCHPKPEYIKKEFGENFTQDETYYILDAGNDANVYLGFQENIDPNEFRRALEHSYESKEVLDVGKYVQKLPAKKHDLFLIPHGTIHCSSVNNMVLEISATPYIFTFKMYDWQRLDLDGHPRPMNIQHAFNNLNFERQGENVLETLVSKPYVKSSGDDWTKIHLPTHPDHFYEIYRYEFEDEIKISTNDQCHILMLVEGTSINLIPNDCPPQTFQFAETFAVPAASKTFRLINNGKNTAKVIVSFVKDEAC
ncbi:class I mannose-6-phosphate isomerase [Kriegella aquimaris]|uniref:Mannose-6-phosphate isomerase, class I n=1 Tax=Kriegella aquimaris TaxID=192904 RepID=A0A1G9YS09_9FLAO|nr:class I mannose-6-phosphate isomerase [Kriegella aquimaris]SDN11186.1 Mannose-6-phosphate isomerase, class I [Kriegella aquimaris]